MPKSPLDPKRARIRQLIASEAMIPVKIPQALANQTRPEGESLLETALREATPEQIERARKATGLAGKSAFMHLYETTGNKVWLWVAVFCAEKPDQLPEQAFQYLRQAGKKFFDAIVDQIRTLETVRITPGQSMQDGITHIPQVSLPLPDVAKILGLARPGRNAFQAAARELRGVNFAAAVEDMVSRTGCSREEAHTALAIAMGRISPEAGPSVETIKKYVAKGKKIVRRRSAKTTR